jgi:hypothetical protein
MSIQSLFAVLTRDIAACYIPAFKVRAKDRETRAMLKVLMQPDWRGLSAGEVIDRLPSWGAEVAFWGLRRHAAVGHEAGRKIPGSVANTKRLENAAAWAGSNGGAEARRRIGYPERLICDLHAACTRLQQTIPSPMFGSVLDALLTTPGYQALLAE